MSGDEIPRLPADVANLLSGARGLEGPSDHVRDRMRERLIAALPPTPGDGGGGGGGGGGGSPREPATLSRLSSWSRAPWWTVAAAFVAGIGAGRAAPSLPLFGEARPAARSEQPRPDAVSDRANGVAPSVPSTTNVLDAPTIAREAPKASVLHPSQPTTTASGWGGLSAAGSLAAERQLLEIARTALGRGNGIDALAAADSHAAKFPRGALAEEREAIAVEALAECKRFDETRQRGERFRRSYPQSILLPAVQAAMEER